MKSQPLFCLIYFLFFYFSINLVAQDTDLHFEHIRYDDGFPQSMISSIEQTENGFIWIGTENGLVRYDGYNFLRFVRDVNEIGSISNNHINVIFDDKERNLWIGTNNGINFFDKRTNKFRAVDILPIKGGRNYISSILEDDQNNLWIGTFGGVKRLNRDKYILENVMDNSNLDLFNRSKVLSLFHHKELGILVGTAKGLKRFDPITGNILSLSGVLADNKNFSTAKIWKIVEEENGDLWLGSEDSGAFLFSFKKNELTNFSTEDGNKTKIASNWIHDIILMDNNTIWFATDNGLSIYLKDKNQFLNYKHNQLNNSSLSDNEIKCAFKDRDGSIWLGTSGGGLNFFNQANLNFVNVGETIGPNFGLTAPMVNAIVNDGNEALWVGTYGGGLNYLDFKNQKSIAYSINDIDENNTLNRIVSLENQDEEYLLCGTIDGVYRFNKKTKKFKAIPLFDNISNFNERNEITTMLYDKKDIWLGTLGNGLIKVKENGSIERHYVGETANVISDNFIVDIENRNDGL